MVIIFLELVAEELEAYLQGLSRLHQVITLFQSEAVEVVLEV